MWSVMCVMCCDVMWEGSWGTTCPIHLVCRQRTVAFHLVQGRKTLNVPE